MLDTLLRDVTHAVRSLRRRPLLSLAAVLSLARANPATALRAE